MFFFFSGVCDRSLTKGIQSKAIRLSKTSINGKTSYQVARFISSIVSALVQRIATIPHDRMEEGWIRIARNASKLETIVW